MYNMMTCQGPGWTFAVFGDCSIAWASFIIVLFLILVLKRQCEDGVLAGTGFNFFGAIVGGLGANIVLTTLTGAARWSLIGGIAGVALGGFLLGQFLDTSGDGE